MARAARRQSELAALKEEVNHLRFAARQLHAGLLEYAKQSNWETINKAHVLGDSGPYDGQDGEPLVYFAWKGEGDGPHVARKFLGLEEEKN